jgi:hypothetical protein
LTNLTLTGSTSDAGMKMKLFSSPFKLVRYSLLKELIQSIIKGLKALILTIIRNREVFRSILIISRQIGLRHGMRLKMSVSDLHSIIQEKLKKNLN